MNNFETSKKVGKPEIQPIKESEIDKISEPESRVEAEIEKTPEKPLNEKPEVRPEVNEEDSELEDSNTEVNMDELHINSSESEQNPETGYETLGSTSSYKSTSGFETTAGESVGMHATISRPISNDQNQNQGSGYPEYERNIKQEVSVSLKVKIDLIFRYCW